MVWFWIKLRIWSYLASKWASLSFSYSCFEEIRNARNRHWTSFLVPTRARNRPRIFTVQRTSHALHPSVWSPVATTNSFQEDKCNFACPPTPVNPDVLDTYEGVEFSSQCRESPRGVAIRSPTKILKLRTKKPSKYR